ncbi:MAG: LuxR C-terminal-related transcriptional regulator [Coriobacteriales bacterium]|jgi:DNA-binding CsgD family transcriptional regulator|nr:LuxR C-terminal-related transcriptional regulator [Coriobacteriales bacterium]
MRDLLARILDKIPPIPFCFMGMGIFRVWTGTVTDSLVFPFQAAGTYACFDILTAAILMSMALLSQWLVPLYKKPLVFSLTAFFMIACACMNFLAVLYPGLAHVIAWPAVISGALGISLILMLWSEFFGCINPLRVALYYSAGIVVSMVILWIFKGFTFYWLWAGTCLIPVVSLWCLWRAYATLPPDEAPHATWGAFSFPWKPILVVCLYSFSFGMHESIFTVYLSKNSGIGELFAALFVVLAVSFYRETFKFSSIWKLAMPLMLASLIPFSSLFPAGSALSDFFALASYTLYTILIMAILSNLVYRYGVCALWIFGIERAVRLLAVQAGFAVTNAVRLTAAPQIADTILIVSIALFITIATKFFFSEKGLSAPWGVVLKKPIAQDRELYLEKNRLGVKCRNLAKQCGLTSREEEILLLLAQNKKLKAIEKELFVAKSTVKTHVKHLYQKLDVHSRTELFELLGVNDAAETKGGAREANDGNSVLLE